MTVASSSAEILSRLARPEATGLPPYNSGLPSELVRSRYGVDRVIRLASNESPFGASPAVAHALTALADKISIYPDAASRDLRAAISARCGTDADHVVIGNGSEDIVQMLSLAFLAPADHVLVQRPGFGLHEIYPHMMGAKVDAMVLTPSLEFDVDAWCAALQRSPKLAFIANPSNPVGCMFSAHEFNRLLAAATDATLLVIDEAYYEYARLSEGYPDTLAVLRAQKRPWIVLRTLSKGWGLAGLRVGYGIASDAALVQLLDKVRTPFNANCMAQAAALAAWGDAAFMHRAAVQTVQAREALARDLRALGVPGLRIAPSATNFLFIDLGRPNGPVNEELLKRGILVKPWKEAGYENFIRVSIGSTQDNALFLQAFQEIMVEQTIVDKPLV
jgi:histidinol-phosphate aminotransferase